MTELEKAREFFIKDRFAMVTTGIEIDEVGEGFARCSLKIQDKHKNATGHVMGGAIFTLADFVLAVATNFNQCVTVTTVSNISYLGSPKGDVLFGESKIIKNGKRLCFYEVEITDNLGTKVATVTSTAMRLDK